MGRHNNYAALFEMKARGAFFKKIIKLSWEEGLKHQAWADCNNLYIQN